MYREAVTTQSPGLPKRQPWVSSQSFTTATRLCPPGATRTGLIISNRFSPGLKQPWALRRYRFAVQVLRWPFKRESINDKWKMITGLDW